MLQLRGAPLLHLGECDQAIDNSRTCAMEAAMPPLPDMSGAPESIAAVAIVVYTTLLCSSAGSPTSRA